MSLLSEARRLHEAGYDLIPLKGKRPFLKNWQNNERLSWDELKAHLSANSNVGVRLGREVVEGRFLACFDVDIVGKLTRREQQECEALVIANISSVDQAAQSATGYGNASRHVYVMCEEPPQTRMLGQAQRKVTYLKNGSTKQGAVWSVQLRGMGAQTVLPPSIHPDTQNKYRWTRGHKLNGATDLPLISLRQDTAPQPKAYPKKNQTDFDEFSIAPLYRTMLTTGDIADYPSRSEAIYAVLGALVRDTELSDAVIESLLRSQPLGDKAKDKPSGWVAAQCNKIRKQKSAPIHKLAQLAPGASIEQLQPILDEASRAGMGPAERDEFLKSAKEISGLSKTALAEELDSTRGDATGQRARLAHGDPVYEEVINRHAFVNWAGKPAIFRERIDAPPWESRHDIMTVSALATFYENKPVMLGKKAANPIELWRADPARREFLEGARMIPPDEECPDKVFNLWQGYAVEPKRGSVDTWRKFVRDIVCAGNVKHTAYLEDWIADMFQHPSQPPGVAVVMRGAEGIGKGTFASALGRIMGCHFRHVTQESQLTGRFNGHFADSALIYADELVWGGDKKHRGALYALVSEKYFMVERKNFDAVPMRNLNRMLIASNNDWVVPTGMDGRRWFVLDVSDKRKKDIAYFETLKQFFYKGGYEAVLEYYLHRKISHDLRTAPVTRALIDQKEAGFDNLTAWWQEVLDRGCVRAPVGEALGTWEQRVSKETVRLSYNSFCLDHGSKPMHWALAIKKLRKLMPEFTEERIRDDQRRVSIMLLAPLDACQEHFQAILAGTLANP